MHNEMITWDALLMTKCQKKTIWERKQFTAPDSKDAARVVAIKLFEISGNPFDHERDVSVKNIIRIGTADNL
jgi:hypothetical protein